MLKDIIFEDIKKYITNHTKDIKGCGVDIDLDFTVEFLAQGEYNLNYKLIGNKEYVFRVNTGTQIEVDNQIKYEYDALKFLEESGITPRVFYLDDKKTELDYGILIMEFLPGRHLNYNTDMKIAGELIGKIHGVPIKGAANFIVEREIFTDRIKEGNRLLKNVWSSEIIKPEVKKILEKLTSWTEKNEYKQKFFIENEWICVNNTELNSGNFLINEQGKSFIIDWEKPVITDPSQDITQFLAKTTTLWKTDYLLNKEDEDVFYKSYIKSLGEDNNIRERVELYRPYLYLRALAWCAYAYVRYAEGEHKLSNESTFKTIKSYLEEEFMTELLRPYGIA